MGDFADDSRYREEKAACSEFEEFTSALRALDAADQEYNRESIKRHDEQVALREWRHKKSTREERMERLLALIWRAYPAVAYTEDETPDGNRKSFIVTWYDDDDMGDLL